MSYADVVRILVSVLFLAMALISCSAEDSRYDEELRNSFLLSCQVEGDASSCGSMLSCIEQKMTQDEYLYEESLMLLTDEISDTMADVAARCISGID